MSKIIEIPFGAKDSELKGWEYTIPEGMEAVIENGKVIVRQKESKDEWIRKFLIQHISEWIGCIEHDLKISSKDIESEKELAMFKEALAYLEKQKEQKLSTHEDIAAAYQMGLAKGRNEQKLVEWREEDEKKRKFLIKGLEDRMGFGWASDPFSREALISWLGNLRPSWRPSEEQMKALGNCFYDIGEGCPDEEELRSLYNDLKKL